MYNNSFSRSNPGLIILLIDQSGSMEDPMPANGLKLAENAADAVNSVINEIILKLTITTDDGDEEVKKSVYLPVIGYGGKGSGTGNQYDYEAEILLDKWINEIEEPEFSKVKSLLNSETDLFEVVKPTYGGGTPMASAFASARDLVAAWIQTHNTADDPTPVIINITDGMPTDSVSELKSIAKEIMAMEIPDGNPLIFNIHLSAKPNPVSIEYPNDLSQCTDEESKLLFELSSAASVDLINEIPTLSAKGLTGGEKLFLSNVGNPAKLIEFLQIGTKVKNALK